MSYEIDLFTYKKKKSESFSYQPSIPIGRIIELSLIFDLLITRKVSQAVRSSTFSHTRVGLIQSVGLESI